MSRSYRFLAPLLIALAIALAGCGKPEDKLVGTYTGKQQLSQETLTKLGKAAKALQDMSLTLNLNKDKTASLSAPGQPTPINGTWNYEANQVQVSFSGAAGGPPMK